MFKNIFKPRNASSRLAAQIQTQAKFAQAIALHQRGQLAQARMIYEEILRSMPRHFDALHLLGVIEYQSKNPRIAVDLIGKAIEISPNDAAPYSNIGLALQELKQLDAAVASFDNAIAIKPDYFEAYFNRGIALQQLKQLDAAIASFDKAIAIKPDYADAYSNRGSAEQELGQFEAAIASYDKAIAIKPGLAEVHSNRGNALKELAQLDAAIASFDKAIALKPDYADAYYNRGGALQQARQFEAAVASYDRAIEIKPDHAEAHSNRGNALKELKQLEAAVASYDKAIAIKPDFAEAHSNRGVALQELKQLDAAVSSFDAGIAINPEFAEAYYNRGVALRELKQLDAAIGSFDRAIAIKPDYFDAYYNRGGALQEIRQLDAAVASFDMAIALKPKFAEAKVNKALALLLGGDFDQGLKLYEWRWEMKELSEHKRNFPQPLWLGTESIKGMTILLHGEQGMGDTIQLCRYAKLVAALGARVIMEVPRQLFGLLQDLDGVTELIEKGTRLPAFDCHCPLLSLPLAFKTDVTTIPGSPNYLRSDDSKVDKWAMRLGKKTKKRIGIVWSGFTGHGNDHNRSMALSRLIATLSHDYEYGSLQKDVRKIDIATLESNLRIKHYGDELQDFSDTAALCSLMDVVVSVDTSVAHLSGALGKPTWIMLPFSPDWRWLLDRNDSPWYPSVKLYRQNADLDWDAVIERVNTDLQLLSE